MKSHYSEKPQRIIFQPSVDNDTKLRQIKNDTGLSISDIINACLDNVLDVEIRTEVKYKKKLCIKE